MILQGSAYVDGEVDRYYIGIEDERIDFVEKEYDGDDDVIEVDGVILPAATDLHVHFRDPGDTHKEDFYTGSLSAAFGGVTTVMDMPNNKPPTDNLKRLEQKIDIGKKKSCIDFGLHGLVSGDVEGMCKKTKFFKSYQSSSTYIEGSEEGVEEAVEKGGKMAYHCEDDEMFGSPGEDLKGHNEYRPPESEIESIKQLSRYPGEKRVCHVTTEKALKVAKENGHMVEVTPHHLFLSNDAMLGPFGKVNPPLRSKDEQLSLWEALDKGEIDFIASDHAPHTEEEKSDFDTAPAGIPGVETMYPLLINSVSMGDMSLSTVVEAVVERPAEYLGVKKGKIEEGYYADLAVFDFRRFESIDRERLHSKAGWSPFEGFNAIFPTDVLSRGEFVVREDEFVGEKGDGRYIPSL